MITDVNLEKGHIGETCKHVRRLQRVVGANRFGASGEKRNCFVLVVGGGGKVVD